MEEKNLKNLIWMRKKKNKEAVNEEEENYFWKRKTYSTD